MCQYHSRAVPLILTKAFIVASREGGKKRREMGVRERQTDRDRDTGRHRETQRQAGRQADKQRPRDGGWGSWLETKGSERKSLVGGKGSRQTDRQAETKREMGDGGPWLETKGSERKSCRRHRKQTDRETDRQRDGGWGSLEESCRRQRQQTDRQRQRDRARENRRSPCRRKREHRERQSLLERIGAQWG